VTDALFSVRDTRTASGFFDPQNDTFELVDISHAIGIDDKFNGAAATNDGRVVFSPWRSSAIGVFTPPPRCCACD
jgi:hypothetical protein|tara:strand:+ start:98 stop:322 length:225 start_codon:yes stop_codon:yes gene_type:complete